MLLFFDKSADMSLIYTDPKYDISDDILKKLGITKKANI
jgi:hypothetical protein